MPNQKLYFFQPPLQFCKGGCFFVVHIEFLFVAMYNVFNMKKVKEYRPNYLASIAYCAVIIVPIMTGFILPKVCKGDFSSLTVYLAIIALLAGIYFLGWLISFLCKPYFVVGEHSFSTRDRSFLCDDVTKIEIELIGYSKFQHADKITFYQGDYYLTEISNCPICLLLSLKKHFKHVKIKGLKFEMGLCLAGFMFGFFISLLL